MVPSIFFMSKQVEKKHYSFAQYSHKDRWNSYFNQLNETLTLRPSSVLEIGVGDKVFGSFLKNNTSVEYKSVDVAEDLEPDIVGSVTSLPFKENSFDVVCAFEVLEHLPYVNFEAAISEIHRVSKKYAVVSLPHFGPPVKFLLKLPFLPEIKLSFKIPFHKQHEFNGEHYWEIGKKDYPLSRIQNDLRGYFKVIKEFVPFENQYHHFFVLERK